MSRLIVITDEVIRQDEVARWVEVLDAGVEKLHIRKPSASKKELNILVNELDVEMRKKLVIHYQPELADEFELGGVHISFGDYLNRFNGKYAKTQRNYNIPVSCSVHSWAEAKEVIDTCAYCFISPVFDSISKTGYLANNELKQVPGELRNKKVYALGGINSNTATEAIENGYYGIVALGHIWGAKEKAGTKVKELLHSINKAC